MWRMIEILEVPDLTLTRYNVGGMQGITSLLEFHKFFLRQWHRKGAIAKVSVHLFYSYDPQKTIGKRLAVFLGFCGEKEKLENTLSLISSSSLLQTYQYKVLQEEEIEKILNNPIYQKCCMLTKREILVRNGLLESEEYYTTAEWTPNEEGRLRQMYGLLKTLNEPISVRIDLYPVANADNIRTVIMNEIAVQQMRIKKDGGGLNGKNQAADMVLKSYENFLNKLDSAPLFTMNVFCFGPAFRKGTSARSDDVELVLDALASEAIEKGDSQIVKIPWHNGDFGISVFLGEENSEITAFSIDDGMEKMFRKNADAGYELMDVRLASKPFRFLPTLFTLEEVAPIFRLPVLDETDDIDIRKETDPENVPEKGSLLLGKDDHGHDVYFPLDLLAKHAFIAGVPGSGKTNLMHHLTSSLWLNKEHQIPFLVFEPAKKEYRSLLNQPGMEDVYLFSPNASMRFPLHINPFEFPKGLMLSEHIAQLKEVFEGSFPLDNPMPFLLDSAIETVYRNCGWEPDMINTGDRKLTFPTMSMLYDTLEEELKKTTYDSEISGNLQSALQVRIGSLLRREMGDIFNTSLSTFSPEEWIEKAVILELEAMGSGPANFMTLLLCSLIRETLKVNPSYPYDHARHVIFIEEAHNLIGPDSQGKQGNDADPKLAATAFIVKMLAEVRALKEGIIIADQLPTVMAPEVIKNTGLKIGLRITSTDDRELLCGTMAANGIQMEAMASYNVGRALLNYEGLKKPFELQTHQWLGPGDNHYIEDKQVRKSIETPKSDAELYIQICERPTYQYIINRSFRNDMRKIKNKVYDFENKIKNLETEYNERMDIINKKADLEKQLANAIGNEENTELLDQEYNKNLQQFRNMKKKSIIERTQSVLKEAFMIGELIENRKKYWVERGYEKWENKEDYNALIGNYLLSISLHSKEVKRLMDVYLELIHKYDI